MVLRLRVPASPRKIIVATKRCLSMYKLFFEASIPIILRIDLSCIIHKSTLDDWAYFKLLKQYHFGNKLEDFSSPSEENTVDRTRKHLNCRFGSKCPSKQRTVRSRFTQRCTSKSAHYFADSDMIYRATREALSNWTRGSIRGFLVFSGIRRSCSFAAGWERTGTPTSSPGKMYRCT